MAEHARDIASLQRDQVAVSLAEHSRDIATLQRDQAAIQSTLVRIESKVDSLKDGWTNRVLGSMGVAIVGLIGVLWTFVKTAK